MRKLNLGILAHVDAGKTTLTERLLYSAGVIDQVGSVDAGTTQTDSMALERQRGITIKSAVVSFVVGDVTINLIDTPGHPDFIAEVERVLSVLDGAVLVISAVEGVQSQTRILMRALQRMRIPTLLFINKLDRVGARFDEVIDEIADRLTPAVVAMGRPTGSETRAAGFASFEASDRDHLDRLTELLSERNDDLLARFVGGERLPNSTLREELAAQTRQVLVHPVFAGAAVTGAGVDTITSAITEFLPAAAADPEDSVSAVVFKVDRGANGEKIAYVRVFSGTIQTRDRFEIRGEEQRVTAIDVFDRGTTEQRLSVRAGEIALVRGLSDVRIGDTLGQPQQAQRHYRLSQPTLETAVVPVQSSEKGTLHTALSQLAEQDPLINLRQDDVRQELYLSLNGEVQKEIIEQTLASEYGVEIEYRETVPICVERPVGTGEAEEILGKAPNPFLATIGLRVEAASINSGIEFRIEADPRTIPVYVYKSVEEFQKTLDGVVRDTLQQGLNGWQVTDCVVTMTRCGYIPPGTSASDFRYLAPVVLMRALKMAGTAVCQPVHRFRVEGPSDGLSATLRELARLDATPRATSTHGSSFVVEGEIAAIQVQQFQQRLRGLTGGEGFAEFEFEHYEPVRGTPPTRNRTDNNPLDFREYLRRITGRSEH